MDMPEEINRLCTDIICDHLFTTEKLASENLRSEGVPGSKIHFVGNVMIDTLMKHKRMAERLTLMDQWGLERRGFATLTLHRPSNVDCKETFTGILEALHEISQRLPIVFPIHPRTRKMAETFGLEGFFSAGPEVRGLWITEPLPYLEFLLVLLRKSGEHLLKQEVFYGARNQVYDGVQARGGAPSGEQWPAADRDRGGPWGRAVIADALDRSISR
jgi:UDP-N-acetylglucosamine 2-epimerase